jgi:hypothetical protein
MLSLCALITGLVLVPQVASAISRLRLHARSRHPETRLTTHSPDLALRTITAKPIVRRSQQHPIMAKCATRIRNVHETEKTHTTATVNSTRPNTLPEQHGLAVCQPESQHDAPPQTNVSPQDSLPTAASVVFSTTELLEQIFSDLDVLLGQEHVHHAISDLGSQDERPEVQFMEYRFKR